jgi:hypothetical protein
MPSMFYLVLKTALLFVIMDLLDKSELEKNQSDMLLL